MERPPTTTDLTAAALALAARGWSVFPLRPGDKRPALHGEEHCPHTGACVDGHRGWEPRATTDPDRIKACWAAGAFNIGIATGPSGLVVVDLDMPKDSKPAPQDWRLPGVVSGEDVLAMLAERASASYAELWNTFTARTGSGGLHLYFSARVDVELHNTAGALGWLVDTRAVGGYVVAPGSVIDGRSYEIVNDAPPMPLPRWLVDRLAGAEQINRPIDPRQALRVIQSGADRRTRYANSALNAEVRAVLGALTGTRNVTLHRSAFALGQLVGDGLLPEQVVVDGLMAAGQAIGLPARECTATIRSGIRAGIAHPRGGAA